ncbi:aminotransferase class V-fold PLP-dependent enzyme [Sanyastnella coralliicola]|uniref:aminotransferase class V-fold PLP-dependent enzyme n=1 Tax=Sanyastnella coralliicola TaxID=3069118 RepID=UPI0027B980B6|nr:cysteine desulfurase [Longitalea sp. SCSIO 12813]
MTGTETTYNVDRVRAQFPILNQEVHGRPLVYFDNAASSQKPTAVIEALREYYNHYHSNIHRGVHHLAQLATSAYEETRTKVKAHLNASAREEIIFTYGTTDGINLIAQSWGRKNITAGDLILISALEHHSNMVPWQMIAEEKGAQIKVIPMNDAGELDQEAYAELLKEEPKLVAFNHVSNALGTVNPAKEMTAAAKQAGATVVIDGAQAIPHLQVDVQDLDCDFYAFSGHKAYGPTGIGILYGKREVLEAMPPWRGGGEMISSVSYERSTYNDLPYKFEAGTPNIADGIALGVALDWMNGIGVSAIAQHEHELTTYATEQMQAIDGMRFIGTAKEKAGVISFLVGDIHPYDLGTLLDQMGVAVRTGHHCTEPLMNRLGIPGTIRVSFGAYNTKHEIDRYIVALEQGVRMLS